MIEIKEVCTKRDLRKFINFAYQMYQDNPNWVPMMREDEWNTLDPKRNPASKIADSRLFLAYRDGEVVGRVAAIFLHDYEAKWGEKRVRFGWLDFIDEEEVSAALLQSVENWAEELGVSAVHGPMGFCDLDREGLLTEGFDYMGNTYTIYNHPYYKDHLEKLGYAKEAEWVEFVFPVPEKTPEKIEKLAEAVKKKTEYRFKYLSSKKELASYGDQIFELYNRSYSQLYGVLPLTEEQTKMYRKQYLAVLDYRLVGLIVDEQGKMVGFGITMMNLNDAIKKANGRLFPFGFIHLLKAMRAKNTYMDMLLVGVEPRLKHSGIVLLMLDEIVKNCKNRKFTEIRCLPELETNKDVQALWKYFSAYVVKRRRVYMKRMDKSAEA